MKRALGLLLGASFLGCGGESAPAVGCDVEAVSGVDVSATDPYGGTPYELGYPPYAVDGCALVYVSTAGDLRRRDLATGGEAVLATVDEVPRRPAVAGDLVAWEATIAGQPVVRVHRGGHTTTAAGPFDHAGEPRVAADAVVFTGWLGADELGDTDVFLLDPSTGHLEVVATGPGQQRFADVSATHVAWTDFREDPDLAFDDDSADVADVGLLDRGTHATITRPREGKQAFPMLGADGLIAYLDWGLVHPEPKFSAYTIRLGALGDDVSADRDVGQVQTSVLYVRPVARGDRINWVSTDGVGTSLLQRGVDLAGPVETVTLFPSGSVFGPSASDTMTLVGASGTNGGVTLRAFTH